MKMRTIAELQQLFDATLKKQQFSDSPRELYLPFDYILGLPGKRMRPVLLLHACEMFGTEAEHALPQALAIELFHNFSLIHDDIMDHAPLRRGVAAVHKKFGSTTAILSGDAMLVMAYKYLVKADFAMLGQLLDIFNDCATKVCEGQQYDMNFETMDDISVADYLTMIELKTATLLAASLQIGALIGGAAPSEALRLFQFGKQLGVSFQLRDDWLDTFGDAEKIGKQAGGDIIQNKKTYLLIEAMQHSDEESRKQLQHWYRLPQFDPEEKVSVVTKLFIGNGIRERTEATTAYYFEQAMSHLEKLQVPDINKAMLRSWAKQLLERDH